MGQFSHNIKQAQTDAKVNCLIKYSLGVLSNRAFCGDGMLYICALIW